MHLDWLVMAFSLFSYTCFTTHNGLHGHAGMTEGGKQRTPDWLMKALGREPAPEQDTKTLKDLFGDDFKAPN